MRELHRRISELERLPGGIGLEDVTAALLHQGLLALGLPAPAPRTSESFTDYLNRAPEDSIWELCRRAHGYA